MESQQTKLKLEWLSSGNHVRALCAVLGITGSTAMMLTYSTPASSLSVQQVTDSFNQISTGATTIADVFFPIAVGIIAFSIISRIAFRLLG